MGEAANEFEGTGEETSSTRNRGGSFVEDEVRGARKQAKQSHEYCDEGVPDKIPREQDEGKILQEDDGAKNPMQNDGEALSDSDHSSAEDDQSDGDGDENSQGEDQNPQNDDKVEQDDYNRKQAREDYSVSVFEPHHRVQIEYPCLELLEEGDEARFTNLYDAEGDRWYHEFPEPFPLVPGIVGQHSLAESSFETLYRAGKGLYPKSAFEEDEDDLYMRKAVDVATQYVGRTKISVAVIEPMEDEDEEEQEKTMLIRWEIEFLCVDGSTLLHSDFQRGSLDEFEYCVDKCPTPWVLDIDVLVRQKTRRAATHAALKMAQYPADVRPHIDWPAPRELCLEEAISKMAGVMTAGELEAYNQTLPEDERITHCNICWVGFGDNNSGSEGGDQRPVRLARSNKHILHCHCLKTWTEQHGIKVVQCPFCRTAVYAENAEWAQPNYFDVDVAFVEDERYDFRENLERSFCDLDLRPVSDTPNAVVVSKFDTMRAWDDLIGKVTVASDKAELRLYQSPEFDTVEKAISGVLDVLDESRMTAAVAETPHNNGLRGGVSERPFSSGRRHFLGCVTVCCTTPDWDERGTVSFTEPGRHVPNHAEVQARRLS